MSERIGIAVRGFGELMITAGVLVLLFVAYELWVTNFYTAQKQEALDHDLHVQWKQSQPIGWTRSPGVTGWRCCGSHGSGRITTR